MRDLDAITGRTNNGWTRVCSSDDCIWHETLSEEQPNSVCPFCYCDKLQPCFWALLVERQPLLPWEVVVRMFQNLFFNELHPSLTSSSLALLGLALLSTLGGEITQTSSSGNCDKKKIRKRFISFHLLTPYHLAIGIRKTWQGYPAVTQLPTTVLHLLKQDSSNKRRCENSLSSKQLTTTWNDPLQHSALWGITIMMALYHDRSEHERNNKPIMQFATRLSSDVYKNCTASQVFKYMSGSNLSGFASQFANRFRGTAKQLRIAERKSANRKNQTRNGETVHRNWWSIAIASNHNPAARCSGARAKAASGPMSAQARSVRVDDSWSKPHQPTASVKTTSFANIKKRNRLRIAFSFASWQQEVFLMWSRTYIHFTNGGAHRFAFLKPDVPGEWLHFDESTKGKSSRIRCLQVCSKHRDWPESNQDFISARSQEIAVKKKDTRVKNRKADMHKRPFLMNNRRRALSTKITRSTKLRKVRWSTSLEDWGLRVSRFLGPDLVCMIGRRLTTRFLSSWSWREGMVSAYLGRAYNNTHKCQNFTNMIERRLKKYETTVECIKHAVHASVCLLHR